MNKIELNTVNGLMTVNVNSIADISQDEWLEIEAWLHGDYKKEERRMLIQKGDGGLLLMCGWADDAFFMSVNFGGLRATFNIDDDDRPIDVLLGGIVCIGYLNYVIGSEIKG